MIDQPVLCLCNYGMVRSKTMANRLNERHIVGIALGMMNTNRMLLWHLMEQANTIVVCNKPNVDENFIHENVADSTKQAAHELLKEFGYKVVVCDTIGRDIWAQENHPDLVRICDEWIDAKTV